MRKLVVEFFERDKLRGAGNEQQQQLVGRDAEHLGDVVHERLHRDGGTEASRQRRQG
jgi:hypothetical protein